MKINNGTKQQHEGYLLLCSLFQPKNHTSYLLDSPDTTQHMVQFALRTRRTHLPGQQRRHRLPSRTRNPLRPGAPRWTLREPHVSAKVLIICCFWSESSVFVHVSLSTDEKYLLGLEKCIALITTLGILDTSLWVLIFLNCSMIQLR